MFIFKKQLSRRTFLRGASVAVGLPLLDAMVPSLTALAQTPAAAKPRLGFMYLPHGAIMKEWTPTAVGKDFELSPILKSLEPFKNQVTIISGLENKPAIGPAVHALNPATWLCAAKPRESTEPYLAPTIDQIAAQHLGQDTAFPSLEFAAESRGGGGGACERNYGCGYGGTLSFKTPTMPLPMESDPRKMLERLFGRGDSPQERKAIQHQYTSILDVISDEAKDLQRGLDAQDKARLGDYFESIREIERRVEKLEAQDLTNLALPDVPIGPSYDQRLNLMFDIIALAYQANLTRVYTYMMAGEATNLTYNHIGVPDAFHPLSHHQNNADKIARLIKIQTYHSQQFAKFLTKLSKMPDGDGSVLDHSLLLYGSNMSNSNAHDEFPLPLVLVGGACGKVKGHQHLKYEDRTPIANLLATILDRVNVPVEKVGDSTGTFSEV